MGLDMYLTGERFVWHNEHDRFNVPDVPFKVSTVVFELCYWRKANHIHRWFVDNIQGGVDECNKTECPKDKLMELLKTVNRVLEDRAKAPDLLPTQSGFFFGGTEYDQYYFQDLEHTQKVLTAILANPEVDKMDLYYRSSW